MRDFIVVLVMLFIVLLFAKYWFIILAILGLIVVFFLIKRSNALQKQEEAKDNLLKLIDSLDGFSSQESFVSTDNKSALSFNDQKNILAMITEEQIDIQPIQIGSYNNINGCLMRVNGLTIRKYNKFSPPDLNLDNFYSNAKEMLNIIVEMDYNSEKYIEIHFNDILSSNKLYDILSNIISKDEALLKEIALNNAKELVLKHIHTLAIKKKRLVKQDDYGNFIFTDWINEVNYFIDKFNLNTLGILEGPKYVNFIDYINLEISSYDKLHLLEINFSESMTPNDYEHFCAKLLIEQDFDARVTKQSGDQGADVIIYSNNKPLIIIQCKLYSSPVGNKAVQEVYSARKHYGAKLALVVTNNTYTRSAIELANTTSVLLLHHNDLVDFFNIIKKANIEL